MSHVISCDTFVVLSAHTENSAVIFGKNSDRPKDEVQEVVYFPSNKYEPNTKLKCTYIEVDQAAQTNAVLLSKPSWMWGAEMGANEHDVVIGNEAIFTLETDRLKSEQLIEPGLLGMDLVRLTLERSNSAAQALEVLTNLLEMYGQSGLCVEKSEPGSAYENLAYHNSFLIADRKEAWVVETVGKHWAAEQITSGFRNISNCLTIRKNITKQSAELKKYALDQGWWNGDESQFDFAAIFASKSNPEKRVRFESGLKLLSEQSKENKFNIFNMMNILRDTESDICRSKSCEFPTQGSQISVLHEQLSSHWFTGTPDPKHSVFKPAVFSPNLTLGLHCSKPIDPSNSWKHLLYSKHEKHYAILTSDAGKELNKTLAELERECVLELKSKLIDEKDQKDNWLHLNELFEDAVEAELRFYK